MKHVQNMLFAALVAQSGGTFWAFLWQQDSEEMIPVTDVCPEVTSLGPELGLHRLRFTVVRLIYFHPMSSKLL